MTYGNMIGNGIEGRYEMSSGKYYYYIKDHLGSTRLDLRNDNVVVEANDYYPFGLKMPGRSYLNSAQPTKEGFTGKELDKETNLQYFGARYYDPAIGRWLSVDNKTYSGWSPYVNVFNNPLKLFDPDENSGKDVTKFVESIDNKYEYFWGGKHPSDDLISSTTEKNIINMSKLLHDSNTTYSMLGIQGSDLGYDCTGFAIAANDANPDRSFNLEGQISKMTGTGSKRLWDFFTSHSEYKKITKKSNLSEGDFIFPPFNRSF